MTAGVPRFSVSQVTTLGWTLEQDLDAYAAAGVPAIGVSLSKLRNAGVERGVRLIRHQAAGDGH